MSSNQPLLGKVALITGGSRGIGRAIALKLASAGADVAIVFHTGQDEAESAVAAIGSLGRKAVAVQADVSDPDSVAEAFGEFRKHFGRLDIVISNAATGVLRSVLELNQRHWRRCLETNAMALQTLAKESVPLMKDGGCLIGMSSMGAYRAIPHYAFIGASKAALEALVRSLAQELGSRGIRVNTVNAGVVDTDALKHFPNREELLAESARRTPMGADLTPSDVANAVYLLCLPEASRITGHTLVVDGGFSISG